MHVCLDFRALQVRRQEERVGCTLFRRALLGNGATFRDSSQLGWPCAQSPLPQKLSVSQKHFPGAQRPALTTNSMAVFSCICCHGLLLCHTLLGMNHLLWVWEFGSDALCCRDWLKLESILLGHCGVCVCVCVLQIRALSFSLQAPFSTKFLCPRINYSHYFCDPNFSFWHSFVLNVLF